MGYDPTTSPPGGNSKIDFFTGSATVTNFPIEMEFFNTHTNISNSSGSMLFYTNGFYVANALNDTMVNGTDINPSPYTTNNSNGLNIPQSHLIIPFPDSSNLYIMFHSTIDNINLPAASFLYYSIIDLNLNNGLGEIINRNQIIISDSLNVGKTVAVKHGNGRDWWIICHKINSNSLYRILVTPEEIQTPTLVSSGINRPPDVGQAYFSPDGSKYAYYWFQHGLEIFDFDRCTGMFSNPIHMTIDNNAGTGIAFSPNSEVLYASTTDTFVQFDLTAANIAASQTVVAVWDSFFTILDIFPYQLGLN